MNYSIESKASKFSLFQNGVYPFEIIEATRGQSSKGNDMITIKFNAFDKEGNTRHVYDYMVLNLDWKCKPFFSYYNLGDKYKLPNFDCSELIGKTGYFDLIIEKSTDPKYKDKNKVAKFLFDYSGSAAVKSIPLQAKEVIVEDVPY